MSDITAEAVAQPEAAPPQQARTTNPKAWWILATVLAVEIMDILDATIVNVALPSIRTDLGSNPAGLQWIVGGYALAFAVGLIIGGRLGDIYGRKRMFIVGVVVFTLTSLLCGLAPSTEFLIAARLLQGLGAAIMIPQGFGLIVESFSEEDIPKAFAFWGPMVSLGAVLGPVVGGLLIELNAFNTDWRAVFLVNVPIGIVAFFLARRMLPEPTERAHDADGIDITGAAIMAIGVGLLIFPLIEGREEDWPAWIFVMFAGGLATLIGFAMYERRRHDAGKNTLIEPSLFKRKTYFSGTLIIAVFFGALSGLLLMQVIYLQVDQHFTAIHSGLTLIPWSFGTAIGAVLASRVLLPRFGRTVMHFGVVVLLIGLGSLLYVLSVDGHDITTWDIALPFIAQGIGLGMTMTPIFNFALFGIEDQELGSASGVLNALQQFGGAAGVAVLGTIFFSVAEDSGLLAGFEQGLVVIMGLMVLIAGLIFLLPMRAQKD